MGVFFWNTLYTPRSIFAKFTSSAALHSSLLLIATWAKMRCTSHSQLPLTTGVPKTFWMSTQSNAQHSRNFASVERLFSVARAIIRSCCNRLSASTARGVTVASYASNWINSSLVTVQTLPDCNFFAFFFNENSDQSCDGNIVNY